MYKLREGTLTIEEFKSKFNEHSTYFPSWMQLDRVKFFVETLTDSMLFKVKPYAPQSLSEVYHVTSKFETHDWTLDWTLDFSCLGKKIVETNLQGQFFKLLKLVMKEVKTPNSPNQTK